MSIIRAYTYLQQARKDLPNTFDISYIPNVCSPWYYMSEIRNSNVEFPSVEVDVSPCVQNVDESMKSVSSLDIEPHRDLRTRLFSRRLINDPLDADKTVQAYVKEFLGVMIADDDIDKGMRA